MTRFRVSSDQIIHEIIEDELMIVNLDNGHYFNTGNSGAFLWPLIVKGYSAGELVDICACRYTGDPENMRNTIDAFLNMLITEGLIVETDTGVQIDGRTDPVESTEKPAFEPPELNKYSDMQDLLLLDPIHDVDEQGWPHPRATAPDSTQS